MTPEIEALLAGYSAGVLTPEETRRLLAAALEDQEVFDALAAELPVKALLAKPAVRRELVDALEGRGRTALSRWFTQPASWIAIAATTAAVFAALWLPPPSASVPGTSRPVWPGLTGIARSSEPASHATLLALLATLPQQRSPEARVAFDRGGYPPVYRLGDASGITFSVDSPSNVLLLEVRPDGSVVQLFPNTSTPFPRVRPHVEYVVPSNAEPPRVITPPLGRRFVRLIAFPVGVEPTRLSIAQLALIQSDLVAVERAYDVAE